MIYMGLFGGVLLLLYGIKLLNDGLQNAAGPRIRSLLRSLTSNRLTAVGAGAFITGLIQSSSATSVMLVGFVSAGLMSFRQTLAVILGADIGATLTVQLIAFHVYDYSILLIGIGLLFELFSKRHLYKNIGQGLLGFGFVFLAIKIMSDAMAPLEQNVLFREVLLVMIGSPIAGILLSAAITGLIHSSAATIGIALAFAGHGLITLDAAIHVVLGANIGTCSTALIASLRAPAEARRVAWAHILFKVLGVALLLPFLTPFQNLVTHTAPDILRQIANAHTLFNAIMAIVFLPFTIMFSKLLMKLVPGQAAREALRASDIVREMLINSIRVFQSDDPSNVTAIKNKDNLIDLLDRHIRLYITRLSASHLSESQTRRSMVVLEISRDLESIGDIIDRNIMPLAMKRINKGLTFSQEGMHEIISFHKKIIENFDTAISAFASNDRDLADRVLRNKEELGTMERELVQAHLDRLRKGFQESIDTSHIHLDLLGNLARINSLITHIIYPIAEEKRGRGREDVGIEG